MIQIKVFINNNVKFFAITGMVLFCILVIGGRWYGLSRCVEIPNGLMIARSAVFDITKPYWTPDVVLKKIDGSELISDPIALFYFTETTAYGRTSFENQNKTTYQFAYRTDTGLIKDNEKPDTYKKLIDEAGLPLVAASVLGYPSNRNLLSVYHKLVDSAEFGKKRCTLPLFHS